jgi:hypothetical protein
MFYFIVYGICKRVAGLCIGVGMGGSHVIRLRGYIYMSGEDRELL